MNNHNERRTVLSTQDEFEKKLRETHDAMLENLAHLPELAESYEVYKVGDDSTPVWRLGDLVSYFAPIQDTRLYSRYPVFRDDGHGECVAYWTRPDALTLEQWREMADTMRRSASGLCSPIRQSGYTRPLAEPGTRKRNSEIAEIAHSL